MAPRTKYWWRIDLYEPDEMTSDRTHGLPFRRIELRAPGHANAATGKHRKLIQERLTKIGYRLMGTIERGALKPRGEWDWRAALHLAQQRPGKEIGGRVSQMERPFLIGPGPNEPLPKARGVNVTEWPRGRPKGPRGNPYSADIVRESLDSLGDVWFGRPQHEDPQDRKITPGPPGTRPLPPWFRRAIAADLEALFKGIDRPHWLGLEYFGDDIGAGEYFRSLPIAERQRLVDEWVEEQNRQRQTLAPGAHKRRNAVLAKKAKKNPYDTRGHTTPAGLGHTKDEHIYRGHRIAISYGNMAGEKVWKAKIRDSAGVPVATLAGSTNADRHDLLEWARIFIDQEKYRQGLPDNDGELFHIMDLEIWGAIGEVEKDGGPVTRSSVAREIQVVLDDLLKDWEQNGCDEAEWSDYEGPGPIIPERCQPIWEDLRSHRYFESLPLSDRLKWLDATVKQYRLQHGLPTTNPKAGRRRPKKKASRSERRKLLRKLLRL